MSGALGSVARLGITAVGYYFGGPLGGFVASIGASMLFPQKLPDIEGQRITDARVTSSVEGAPMSEFFGKWVTEGQVWWDGGLVEHRETDKVGKGGSSQKVVSYSYTRSYALGLGKSIKSVRRIWRLNQLIYDRRPQLDGETDADFAKRLAASDELEERMRIYTGTMEQLPDPTIEAAKGVGNAPAYRKRSYLVFTDDPVDDTNGAIPTFRVEVSNAGYEYTPTSEISTDVLPDWVNGTADPRLEGYSYEYRYGSTVYASEALAVAAAEADLGYSLSKVPIWRRKRNGENPSEPSPLESIDGGADEFVNFQYVDSVSFGYLDTGLMYSGADYNAAIALTVPPDSNYPPFTGYKNLGIPLNTYFYANVSGGRISYEKSNTAPVVHPAPTVSVRDWLAGNNCVVEFGCPYAPYSPQNLFRNMTDIGVRRVPAAPPVPGFDKPDWPVNPDDYRWDPDTGEIFSKAPWVVTAGSYRCLSLYRVSGGGTSQVTRLPLGPILPVGHPDDNATFWQSARDAAVAAGTLPSSVNTYVSAGNGGIDTFPRNIASAYTRTYNAVTVLDEDGDTLANIVRRCGRLAKLTDDQIDVTDLSEVVDGYALERLGLTARGAIDTLRPYGFFDCVASGLGLKWPRRGKASVAELTEDDLGCHAAGTEEPDRIRPDRSDDVPLPQMVRVTYINPDSEFQRGQQIRGRVTAASENKLDVELPIVMIGDKAAQIRDVLMAERYIGRETYTDAIRPKWAWLEPADPIVLPIRGQPQRAIITRKRFVAGGRIDLEFRRDDATPYYATPAGVPSGIGEQTLEALGDTTLVVIDGPATSDSQNDAGLHLAARGEGARWKGCGIFESLDGGNDFSRITTIDAPATMGRITSALPAGPYHLWDRVNSIEVTLDSGTLSSVTEQAAAGGANAAWLGAAGRWQLLLFADAVLTGTDDQGRKQYQVSTLLQGRLGTEWAIGLSEANDHFILASTCFRLPLDRSAIGVPRIFKAVSFGKLVESGPTQGVTPEAVALKPFAPSSPDGVRNGAGDLDIYAVRRARGSGEWNDNDFVPLNEESEAYEVDVLDGITVVRTLRGSSFPISYLAADQTIDFGSAQAAVSVAIYQLSATVGRGYPLEAIL